MNAHAKPAQLGSPLAVTDPEIQKLLQLAGLRFMCSSAQWLKDEAIRLGTALKSGAMTSDEVDVELVGLGALDLVYPELMVEEAKPLRKQWEYRTPQATVDAFFGWIVRQDEVMQGQWLADHPRDAAYLRELWRKKCKPQSK
jgi:hypothetical protein